MEDVVVMEVLEAKDDLFSDSLLILEGRVRFEQICELQVIIHDDIHLMLLRGSLRSMEVDDLIASDDVAMGEALQTVDFSQTTEIDALAVVVGFLVELDGHELRFAEPLPAEELLQEGSMVPLLPLVEVDRTVAA